MRIGTRGLLLAATALLVATTTGVLLAAGQAAPAAGQRQPMAEDVFKDIRVLKGIPPDEFMGTMGVYASSLGMNCSDCHSEESGGDWAHYADETPKKAAARRMTAMVQAINRANFQGQPKVTCFTCHRGSTPPEVTPSIDLLYSSPPSLEPGDQFKQAQGQPSPDQVFDKYLAAIGGAQKVAALTSYVAKGTYRGYDDPEKSQMEIYAKAPGMRTTIVHGLNGDTTSTVDGRNSWIASPAVERPLPLLVATGQDLEGIRFEVNMLFPANVKTAFNNWRVGFQTAINDRDVRIVQGTTASGGLQTLCFDMETGLLVRLVRQTDSPVGHIMTRIDFDDYREVPGTGVKIPHKWVYSWLDGRSVYEVTSVQPNVAIEASRFNQPPPSTPRARAAANR